MEESWDDPLFQVPVISGEAEEPFVPPRPPASEDAHAIDRPVLLLDLAALSAQLGGGGAASYAAVRSHVLSTLQADFERRSNELLASGLCWHTMRSCAAEEREEREAARAGSFLTVIEYPDELHGVAVEALWEEVVRPTAWECLDEIKMHLATCNRGLQWKVEIAAELDALAEAEAQLTERRAGAARALDALSAEREEMLGAMHASHAADSTPLRADDITRMLAQLDAIDRQIEEAREAHEVALGEGGPAATREECSSVALLLDLIFEFYPQAPDAPWYEHVPTLKAYKQESLRMWRSTFGRLPKASETALKHAAPVSSRPSHARPRLRVPLPPNAAPRTRDAASMGATARLAQPITPQSSPHTSAQLHSSPREVQGTSMVQYGSPSGAASFF
ncbi:hypothetical protein AB1Y20_010062 [Prymnesium parvum]|uniref:Uncharacterized protein n=1 Tax=Prymnesium parvum TaxID=97485 RepID=A0AB34K8C9_PRYPA